MKNYGKPKIGILALMLGAYEPLFPGIIDRQTAFVHQVIKNLGDTADFVFSRVALGREDIETLSNQYNNDNLDGILIFLLTYSQGQYLIRAMQNNRLPLALALIQPDETVEDDFEELDLTVNQGIHGSQDNANCLLRAGIKCSYFAGSRFDGLFNKFVLDFAKAAQTARLLKNMKIGVIGKLAGMGDIQCDDISFFRNIGPEFIYDSIGSIYSNFAEVTEKEIEERVALDRTIFEMDPNLSYESHAYAVKLYLGIKKYLEKGQYAGYTAHFEEFGADGRFEQLPLLAASHLMADGYGYGAEGDGMTAALVAALNCLCGNANFSEMYMMDIKREAILFCHAGEGNWSTCDEKQKPRLIDRYFGEGGLGNPPTAIFTPKAGKATVLSITHINGNKFRMVAANGEILSKNDLKRCEMPYFFFKPDSGVKKCVEGWLNNGGTHHEAVVLGDYSDRIKLLCDICGIELISV